MKRSIVASIIVAALEWAAVSVSGQIVLARKGQAQCVIVFSATNQPVLNEAVKDLCDYLGKVTGADFRRVTGPTRLVILDQPPTDAPTVLSADREAFWIDARDREIRIAGGGPIGAAYGIYYFLEKHVGVRWFLPADDGEYVPQEPDFKISATRELHRPAFTMRWVGTGEWALRNRCNPLTIGTVSTIGCILPRPQVRCFNIIVRWRIAWLPPGLLFLAEHRTWP